jgi:hypothetical protein
MVQGQPCVREAIKRTPNPAAERASVQAKKPPLGAAFGHKKPQAASAPAATSLEKTGACLWKCVVAVSPGIRCLHLWGPGLNATEFNSEYVKPDAG